jgi:hypothetical protein
MHTISLSMLQFEADELMSVGPETIEASRVVSDAPPVEMDLMLSLVAEPKPIVLDDYRERETQRLAG